MLLCTKSSFAFCYVPSQPAASCVSIVSSGGSLFAMRHFHVHVTMLARYAFMPAGQPTIFGPRAMGDLFRHRGIKFTMCVAGAYTIMYTARHNFRYSDACFTVHPRSCLPYSHRLYLHMGVVSEMPEWDVMHTMFNRMPMSAVPDELCGTDHFIDRFVRSLSCGIYRETYIMGKYEGSCDFRSRFSMDELADSYELGTCESS